MVEVTEVLQIKSYTKKELRLMYCIHPNTLSLWLKKIEFKLKKFGYKRTDKRLSPKHVSIFFSYYGEP